MASNVNTTTELRIRIPEVTVDFTPDVSPEISPISFVGEDGQMWQGEQENQEQGCQEQESDGDYYADDEGNCPGSRKCKGKGKGNRKALRMLIRKKAPSSNQRNRVQKNGRAAKICSIS